MKKFFYVVAALATIFLVTYTYIGGFSASEAKLVTSETIHVVGIPFEGAVDDRKLGEAFQKAAQLVDTKKVSGMLGNIYYNNPDQSSNSLKAFIGIIVPDTSITLPEGYELRTIHGGKKVIHAESEANIAILPKKLYNAAFDYAEENKLKLEDFYIEWFPARDQGVVEVPVKK